MAKPVGLAIMGLLLFISLILLWAPSSFPWSSGIQPVGKISDSTVTSVTAADGDYLLGVGKADITG